MRFMVTLEMDSGITDAVQQFILESLCKGVAQDLGRKSTEEESSLLWRLYKPSVRAETVPEAEVAR